MKAIPTIFLSQQDPHLDIVSISSEGKNFLISVEEEQQIDVEDVQFLQASAILHSFKQQ